MKEKLDLIYQKMLEEHPQLEATRKTSNKNISLAKNIIWIGFLVTFIGIISGNFFLSFGLFFGLALLMLVTHFLTIKRLDYEQDFDKIKFKYIQALLEVNDDWSLEFMDKDVPTECLEEGRLFEPNLSTFENIVCKNRIKGTYNNFQINIMEIDLQHKKYKYAEVAPGWSTSILVTFDYPLAIGTSKITLFQKECLTNLMSNDIDLSRIIPIRGKKLNIKDTFLDKKYDAYELRNNKSEPAEIEHLKDILLNLEKTYYKDRWKFISLYKNKIAILIFDKKIFNIDTSKSLLKTNPFIPFYYDLVKIYSIISIFKLNSGETK